MSVPFDKKLNQIAEATDLGELAAFLPAGLPPIQNPQTDVPSIAKDERLA